MNNIVPIITTSVRSGHNPGDTFIGLGAQYLTERVLGECNWQIVCRFSSKRDWTKHKNLIDQASHIVYAGMPQYNNYDDWKAWYDDKLWTEVIVPNNYRVVSLAGGSGYPSTTWKPEDFSKHCRKSKLTVDLLKQRAKYTDLFTVRDQYAHALLNDLGITNHHLPCSATFASHFAELEPSAQRPYCALVLPAPKAVPVTYRKYKNPSEELEKVWVPIYKHLKKQHNVKVVCHYYDEYNIMKNIIPNGDVFFTSDYFALLKFYTKAHVVVSARLHGTLPAYGMLGTQCVGITIDTRGHAVKIFPKIPTVLYQDMTIETLEAAIEKAIPSSEKDFSEYLQQYDVLISNVMQK